MRCIGGKIAKRPDCALNTIERAVDGADQLPDLKRGLGNGQATINIAWIKCFNIAHGVTKRHQRLPDGRDVKKEEKTKERNEGDRDVIDQFRADGWPERPQARSFNH